MDPPLRSPLRDAKHPIPAVTGSPVRSPLRDAENPAAPPPQTTNPLASQVVRERAVMGSPVRSPLPNAEDPQKKNDSPLPSLLRDAEYPTAPPTHQKEDSFSSVSSFRSPVRETENPTAAPPQTTNPLTAQALVVREVALMGSPVRSPHRNAKDTQKINDSPLRSLLRDAEYPIALPTHQKEDSFSSVSSFRSPLREVENPTGPPPQKENVFSSQIGYQREGTMTVGSTLRSQTEDPILLENSAAVAANWMMTREMTSATKVGGRGKRLLRVESGIVRRSAVWKAALGLRVSAVVLSLASFSLMAADKTSGWAGDSFDRYKEFRYCLSVNVIVFVYSSFQLYAQVHHKIKKKLIMSRSISYYFDFSMDQILAYLLISASSSAASRNYDWVSSFGSDDFTKMIDGSVAVSFLAFFALAISSLISVYKLFSWNS